MAKLYTYRCPSCKKEFTYLQHPSDAPVAPRFCPVCGFDTEAEDQALEGVIGAPHIARPIAGIVDRNYREMEAGAEHRANMAREQGLDDAAANDLKLTDMRDNVQVGESSVVPITNDITRVMDATPGVTGFTGANGAGFASTVSQGAFPNAGARAQNDLRRLHSERLQNSGHAGAVSSIVPTLETQSPFYKSRV